MLFLLEKNYFDFNTASCKYRNKFSHSLYNQRIDHFFFCITWAIGGRVGDILNNNNNNNDKYLRHFWKLLLNSSRVYWKMSEWKNYFSLNAHKEFYTQMWKAVFLFSWNILMRETVNGSLVIITLIISGSWKKKLKNLRKRKAVYDK